MSHTRIKRLKLREVAELKIEFAELSRRITNKNNKEIVDAKGVINYRNLQLEYPERNIFGLSFNHGRSYIQFESNGVSHYRLK